MAYTPELTKKSSSTLRRLAWANGKPMTKTLEEAMNYFAYAVDRRRICAKCKDKTKCDDCVFQASLKEKSSIHGLMRKSFK